ncbi:hypothetical protein DYB31_008191 [Aphanomyces astaci]|uniref:Lipoxygenase domain-containing protein n=1 Tax=Aphanomyces astaci TaxID=112090 RepID=A0A397EHB0_APHAT|nr:hypothetical protein DYB31_008191 [Aphanomyces astaci]
MGHQASTERSSNQSVHFLSSPDDNNQGNNPIKLDGDRADLSVLEFALSQESVVGFFGVDGVREFDAKFADGSLVRHGSLPHGYVDLLGPILPSLDGQAYDHAHDALRKALSGPSQLNRYKSVLRDIVHREHHRWAARGGVQSLATTSADLVFHIFLALLFGMDDTTGDQVKGLHSVVDNFIQGMRKSLGYADRTAVKLRGDLLKTLVDPALARSRDRVAQGVSKACVLDALVADKQLDDHAIRTHMFHVLVTGLSSVESLVVNSITALCVFEEERAKLVQARAEFAAKYPTVDERWSHLDDLGYIHRFLKEVTRYYVAGPNHIYGRATRDVDIATTSPNNDNKEQGVLKLPRGTLCTAVLEATTSWPDAAQFSPNRFLHQEHVELFPRALDEHIRTLVLQSVFVSLLDYEWKMLPFQDYSLAENEPHATPKGGLMAVNFKRRCHRDSNDGNLFEVAGCHDDWKFLALPEAKAYRDNMESLYDMFTDSRLDSWTHLMIQLLQTKQAAWEVPNAATALKLPQFQKILPKINLLHTSIMVPTEDEDTPLDPWYEKAAMVLLRDTLPIGDNFTDNWVPGEDMEAYVMQKVGKMWPRVNVHWNDRYSDRALELIAFNGFGQHLVEKLSDPHDDGSYYGVLLDFMHVLEVRPGYAKYGADAFFTRDGKVVKIVRGGNTYMPGDDQWEYVKFCFRSSLNTKVTAVDHLLGIHSMVANYLTTSSREYLPVNHPLRRLIKPFTFRSVVINYAAAWALFWPKGMLHRGFALTEQGMKQTWDYGIARFNFTTFPQQMASQGVDSVKLPYHEDGLDYWNVLRTFVSNYVDLYYTGDDAVQQDQSVIHFWDYLDKLPGYFPPLSLDNLKDVLAQCIMWVTGMHNHLGTLAEYVSDPAFCGSAWVEGEAANRPGSAVRIALIMSATGFVQPSVLEDFSHVMLDDKAKGLCHAFTASLHKLADTVDARNSTREQKYVSFDPKTIELAVSI